MIIFAIQGRAGSPLPAAGSNAFHGAHGVTRPTRTSTYDASIGHFNSLPIEMVLTVFQILAALNFATHYPGLESAWASRIFSRRRSQGDLGRARGELYRHRRVSVRQGTYADFPTALRHAIFNVVSIATDSGLHTQDYSRWPIFAPMWMIFLSCIVASSGSTGGGIKMIRTLVLAKQANRELNQLVHPNMVRPLKVGGSGHRQPRGFRRVGVRVSLFHEHRHADFRAVGERLGFHDGLLGHHRVHQQRRSRAWAWWVLEATTACQRFSDVGLFCRPCCWEDWRYSPFLCFSPPPYGENRRH